MARCDFCKGKVEPGTGKKFIYKDGTIMNFCSSKCEKHVFVLRHKGRSQAWTEEAHKIKKSGKLTEEVEKDVEKKPEKKTKKEGDK